MTVLEARGIQKWYGGVAAVDGIDLRIEPGESVGLIGPNGAGKTTLFDCLCGYTEPDAGQVIVAGRDVSGLPPEERARAGLGRTFQQLEVFPSMTVREHLEVAFEQAGGRNGSAVPPEEALERFQLAEHAGRRAGGLPTGTLRRIEVARAVCTGARILLLDEPASGLDPGEMDDLSVILAEVVELGQAVFLVEHDVRFVLDLADRVVVLHMGSVIAEDTPQNIVDDPEVRRAYLGDEGA